MKDTLTVLGVGDVGPMHEPIASYSTLVRTTLAQADFRFAHVERPYTDVGVPQLNAGAVKSAPATMLSVFADCGFDVVSAASNHAMDLGPDGMLDTVRRLRAMGIQVVGAGETLEEALQPAYVERHGVRVAFLAFCSVLREGCEGGPARPGIAPMRAHTYYEAQNYQPGMPARTVTLPHAEDLAQMKKAIAAAKQQADAVVLSLHWGVAFIPRLIADYQPLVAEAAFAAGADIIFGHHAHLPKAVGVHAGKVCFYSLSHFIMSSEFLGGDPQKVAAFEKQYSVQLDPEYPRLPYGMDAKHSLIAKAVFSRGGVEKVSFLPVMIDQQLRPQVLRCGDPRFEDNLRFLEWVSQEFGHRFTVEGDEVVVTQG